MRAAITAGGIRPHIRTARLNVTAAHEFGLRDRACIREHWPALERLLVFCDGRPFAMLRRSDDSCSSGGGRGTGPMTWYARPHEEGVDDAECGWQQLAEPLTASDASNVHFVTVDRTGQPGRILTCMV